MNRNGENADTATLVALGIYIIRYVDPYGLCIEGKKKDGDAENPFIYVYKQGDGPFNVLWSDSLPGQMIAGGWNVANEFGNESLGILADATELM